MLQIPDDPIISCMERTGYPPWFIYPEYGANDEVDEEDDQIEPEEDEGDL